MYSKDTQTKKFDTGLSAKIKTASEEYVEKYWRKKRGENVDEEEAFEDVLAQLPQGRMEENRAVLDEVAKENMSTYYNMLLPQAVIKSQSIEHNKTTVFSICIVIIRIHSKALYCFRIMAWLLKLTIFYADFCISKVKINMRNCICL